MKRKLIWQMLATITAPCLLLITSFYTPIYKDKGAWPIIAILFLAIILSVVVTVTKIRQHEKIKMED